MSELYVKKPVIRRYRVKGKVYDSRQKLADGLGVSLRVASLWIKKKLTKDGDVISTMSEDI